MDLPLSGRQILTLSGLPRNEGGAAATEFDLQARYGHSRGRAATLRA